MYLQKKDKYVMIENLRNYKNLSMFNIQHFKLINIYKLQENCCLLFCFFFGLTGCHADNLWHDQKCHKPNLLTNKMHFSHFVRITHKIHNLNSNSFSRMLLLKMANNFATLCNTVAICHFVLSASFSRRPWLWFEVMIT